MASQAKATIPPAGEAKPASSKPTQDPNNNLKDVEGNVPKGEESNYGCWQTPIARLAAAASLSKEIPTAGWYGIEHSKEPEVDIPPESYLYDEDRPWVLGKLNKAALDYPEPAEPVPLPQSVVDYLDALEAAEIARINKSLRGEAENVEEKVEKAEVKTKAPSATEPVKVVPKSKSRNPSVSPGKGLRKTSRSSTPASPRPATPSKQLPKLPKSPGRGDAPSTKVAPTTKVAPGPKKTLNAKVDVEIVESKN